MAGRKKGGPPSLKIHEIAEALKKSGGFISHAAEMLGVTQSAITQRVQKSEELQRVRREAEERYLDLSETELLKQIKSGNTTAILFHLKCKGKHRGYVEKQIIQADVKMTHDDWIKKIDEST